MLSIMSFSEAVVQKMRFDCFTKERRRITLGKRLNIGIKFDGKINIAI